MADDYTSDSGSSSDSGSGSSDSSSSGSSDSRGIDFSPVWGVVADVVADIVADAVTPSAGARGPSVLRQQYEAEAPARSEAYERAIRQLFFSPAPTRKPSLLQEIVAGEQWFVPIRPDGSYETVLAAERQYGLAIGGGPNRREKGRQPPRGKGGRLLPIFDTDPGRPAVALDGRALVRSLSDDVDGLLIEPRSKKPRELGREHLAELLRLADACDEAQRLRDARLALQSIIARPGPDQAEPLLRATWWVAMPGGSLEVDEEFGSGARVVRAFTHPDLAQWAKLTPLDGATLFRLVAEDETIDGVVVDSLVTLGEGRTAVVGAVLSPGFAQRLLAGEDIRPGARPLPARSRREVELWLELHGFPWKDRELVETPSPDGLLVRAKSGTDLTAWRLHETLGRPSEQPGPVWSPVFSVPSSPPADDELGDCPTRILCAGLLASKLGAESYRGADPRSWRTGRWLGFGRFVGASGRSLATARLRLAVELHKLLPPDSDRIPRSAILTVKGATILRKHPHGRSRAWIEATLHQAARYTGRWVWSR